jgi:hypothetical protein
MGYFFQNRGKYCLMKPFSDTSIFVHVVSHQKLSLATQHILPFVLGVILGLLLLREYILVPQRRV